MGEGKSLRARRGLVQRSWDAFVSGHDADEGDGAGVRAEVLDSWRRTLPLLSPHVAAAPLAEPVVDPGPLLNSVHVLDQELRGSIQDSHLVVALADARGRLVWTAGERRLLRLAEQANFTPGALWDEANMGINAISLAMTSDHPATVWSAEHWSASLHCWACYSAPVRHPGNGRRLGVLNFSTAWDRAHPLAATAVIALAQRLAIEIAADGAAGPPEVDERIVLQVLGGHRVWVGERRLVLTRRQLEIALLLALHPGGITPDRLHADLYGDARVALGTLKAEVSHLRRILGGRISRSPYRLQGDVTVDALDLLSDLRQGRVREAAGRFAGPLLPWSESPRILRLARTVEVALRDAVLAGSDCEAAVALATLLDEDPAVAEHALVLLAPTDTRRHVLQGQLNGLSLQV
jgi:hypothetical protein